jgi:hypothetical protein
VHALPTKRQRRRRRNLVQGCSQAWSGQTGSLRSEFSYGVLQLVAQSCPGEKATDPEHGVLKMSALA